MKNYIGTKEILAKPKPTPSFITTEMKNLMIAQENHNG